MNLGQMLVNSTRRFPQRPAVVCGERVTSYAELNAQSARLAAGLDRLGVDRDARVAVFMRNRVELLATMYACFRSGRCFVPLNSRFTVDEVTFHVADSGASVLVTDDVGMSTALPADLTDVHIVVAGAANVPPPALAYDKVLASEAHEGIDATVDRDTLAWLFYTSGTTGRPKGAMLTHANLDFVVASWLADLTPLDEHDVTLHAAPLSHGAGFHALAAVARGAAHVIPYGVSFDPVAILELMREAGVTNTWLVPTQIVMLTDAMREHRVELPALEAVAYGGAPMAESELRAAIDAFGPVFVQLYGQGETPMTATVLSRSDHVACMAGIEPARLSSAGYARPGMDVRILDSEDREVDAGGVGEVCVRGPAVMAGYWQRDEATAEALRNGWLHTGDLGRMDEAGCLYLLDRAKDLIISGGSNVYASEVEQVLAAHPGVRDVGVVGVPDRTWGETVVAVIVREPDTEVSDAELDARCAAVLANYKRPRRYIYRDELPRNAYGKVLKRELRGLLIGKDER